MRILLFPKEFPSESRPGAGIFVLRRAQALRDLGHDVGVVRIVPLAPPFGAKWNAYNRIPAIESIEGFEVSTIRAAVPPRMIGMEYLHLQVLGALRREIRRFRADVLHASFLIPNGQIAVRLPVPAVVTAHGGDAYSWPYRRKGLLRAAKDAVRRASGVTAVSGYIASWVNRLAERRVEVIWNGADERYFYPRNRSEARAALQLPEGRFVIAFAGNILRAKGLFELVEAAASLADLNPIVALAGEGADAAELTAKARDLKVDLRMLGALPSACVGELFGAADVVTLPSYAEGLPNVVCEAMLSERAVVASTAGGTPEILEDECTGLLTPPKDTMALSNALRRPAESGALRDRLARAARDFAKENLTWRVSAQKYECVYREVLAAT